MKSNTPTLRLQDLETDLDVNTAQIADLDLSKLPPKVCLRIKRPDGIVEIQHVGKKLHVRLHADVALDTKCSYPFIQAIYDLRVSAFREARYILDRDRMNAPLYISSFNPITITVPRATTGSAAMLALDSAVGNLIGKTSEILGLAAGGITLVYPEDDDLD